MPRVSICVPNLNNRPFLPARFESIFNQTLQDWELIVCDSYSDDGAWEYIQELAAREPRMRISQTPRQGAYAGFNDCIRLARGEYVYIATSDDTMTPDCLEKLAAALDRAGECGLAHCCLDFIDEGGSRISTGHCWDNWFTTRFFGEWNKKYHVRPPGHDTIVALSLRTVYYSVTQILIRRNLFANVGLFENKWGSFGDLEWQMRAALAAGTVHVPEYLATWRIHPAQASQIQRHHRAVQEGWFLDMANDVIEFSRARNLPFEGGLPNYLAHFYWDECMVARLRSESSFNRKGALLLKSMRANPKFFLKSMLNRFRIRVLGQTHNLERQVRANLSSLGLALLLPAT